MSPEEERKERLAKYGIITAFIALTAAAVCGMFWGAAKGPEKQHNMPLPEKQTEKAIKKIFDPKSHKTFFSRDR